MNNDYLENYYSSIRYDIEPFLNKNISRLLSIGSGSGRTERYYKEKLSINQVVAVEKEEFLNQELAKNVDKAITGDIQKYNSSL